MDRAGHHSIKKRVGCPSLFAAVARARPRLHCFGHIHEQWGAKLVSWRANQPESATPSHFTAIDNGWSVLIDQIPGSPEEKKNRWGRYARCRPTSHCAGDENPINFGEQTLFINVAIQGTRDFPVKPPWLVDIELPSAC
jgi:hypothetical protein